MEGDNAIPEIWIIRNIDLILVQEQTVTFGPICSMYRSCSGVLELL